MPKGSYNWNRKNRYALGGALIGAAPILEIIRYLVIIRGQVLLPGVVSYPDPLPAAILLRPEVGLRTRLYRVITTLAYTRFL